MGQDTSGQTPTLRELGEFAVIDRLVQGATSPLSLSWGQAMMLRWWPPPTAVR
ncbi:thiamine-monophosphate kinase ThiL domain protein [Mycobacterium ulcerans str. Harvey]|uniref:Thiamine-monophosphate kinase ThiL domain protein n=1 Tax=Mycobacterium ulcerans str. Harvey TaxID=1299332 RepID=A0ABP3AGH9_MYCUL|nr:thiamine-monophosphate kinase ThiL domain protein [Mycobacterium ulcerans str. Harvey]